MSTIGQRTNLPWHYWAACRQSDSHGNQFDNNRSGIPGTVVSISPGIIGHNVTIPSPSKQRRPRWGRYVPGDGRFGFQTTHLPNRRCHLGTVKLHSVHQGALMYQRSPQIVIGRRPIPPPTAAKVDLRDTNRKNSPPKTEAYRQNHPS